VDESEALTKREAQIVEGIRLGLTNKQIGRKLGISPTTVKTHLEHIFVKLGVSTRVLVASAGTRNEMSGIAALVTVPRQSTITLTTLTITAGKKKFVAELPTNVRATNVYMTPDGKIMADTNVGRIEVRMTLVS